jgi:hypothetical protein
MDTLLLPSMQSEYKDLQYYTEVHWLLIVFDLATSCKVIYAVLYVKLTGRQAYMILQLYTERYDN